MSESLSADTLSERDEGRLDQFKLEWMAGSAPDIKSHVVAADSESRYLSNLIELDLEYRWKRYDRKNQPSPDAVDEYGFALFPKLEDYTAIETVDTGDVVTAVLVAEEYRVRTRWGDRPAREEYLSRFSLPHGDIRRAIDRVETELKAETLHSSRDEEAEYPSRSQAFASTVTYKRDGQPAHADSARRAVPKFLNHYRLDSIIGQGGFGEVWKAYDTRLKEYVAIKFPRPDRKFPAEVLEVFKQEGEKLAGLRDIDGVVTIYAAGKFNGHPYLVSRLIDGEDLARRLKRSPLSHEEAAELVATVAEILHRAHTRNLVHRDVKPHNILLDANGRAFLTDFGLAITEQEQLREDPGILGTYAYMSPEQARGENQLVDGRTDIYSLGVVLYEALTGRLPFIADEPDAYKRQILEKEARPLRTIDETIPEALELICLKCLSKNAPDRYTTAKDFARELRRASAVKSKRSNHRAAILTGGVAILLLLGFALSKRGSDAQSLFKPRLNAIQPAESYLTPIAWATNAKDDFFGKMEPGGRVAIKSSASLSCFETNRPQSEHYRMRAHAELQHKHAVVGFVLGIHKVSKVRGEYRCVVVYVGSLRPLKGVWVTVEESEIVLDVIGRPRLQGRRLIMRRQLQETLDDTVRLELEIDREKITAMKYNGEPIDEFDFSVKKVTIPKDTACGIVVMGHVVFHSINCQEQLR